MAWEFVSYDVSEAVAVVTIDHPPANALNTRVIKELVELFTELESRKDVLAVIVTAAGNRFFVGGADIPELLDQNTVEGGSQFSVYGHRMMNKVEAFDRPVIAAINGFALGGGGELAMVCDIRMAAESARFGMPEVNLGVIPGAGGTQRLPRLVGRGRAKDLMMSGDIIDSSEALRIGLVDRVVPDAQLMTRARELASKIAAKGPVAVRLVKRAVNEGVEMPLADALKLENHLFGEACATEDKNEGVKAFLEKRPPRFRNR
ncbi:MAG: enoyl-CoA hydratase-related protein [Chloroflexi bacterium]|nr:enoyl-CoA hydratase-related protein [Chloroflexota bacterium]